MAQLKLVIGTKNYSSWSLRPWLLLRHFGIEFDELELTLDTPVFAENVRQWSPTMRVPVLIDGGLRVWDSLAICEYVNEAYLGGGGWPALMSERALARSLVAEMHSGFASMRAEMPMDVCRIPAAGRAVSEGTMRDAQRVQEIWDERLSGGGGPWLFGPFSIADAFFSPVVFRFLSYATKLTTASAIYCDRMVKHPDMLAWMRQCASEGRSP